MLPRERAVRQTGACAVVGDRCAGKPVDWKELFEAYQATVDWPGCTFYKELMEV